MTSEKQNDFAFSEDKLRERKKSIGASECGAVLGVQGAFRTPYQVWLDKTTPEVTKAVDSVYTRRGTILEAYVIKAAELKWGRGIRPNNDVHGISQKTFLTATPDGWYVKDHSGFPDLVQIKTSTENQEGNYGLEGTADVPLNYLFQCYHEMLVTGAESVDLIVYFATEPEFDATIFMTENMDIEQVALYISNSKLKKYHIERNEDRLKRLEKLLTEFWQCVEDVTPPKTNAGAEDFIFNSPPPEVIEIDGSNAEIARDYLETKINLDMAQKLYDECRAMLRENLREGTIWSIDGNNLQFKRNKPGSKTNWETLAKDAFVDKQAIRKCKEIVATADLSERERLAILKGLEANDLNPKLVDRFIKSANSKSRPIAEDIQRAFTALSDNCRIPPEVVLEYTNHYPGAKVLRNKKDKENDE